MSTVIKFIVIALALVGASCSVQETSAPPLTGPSELGLRINLQAVPDSILQDGASQAVVSIDASGPDGRPARGLALRAEILVDGVIVDYGTLSAKSVVTGDDGRARVIYTAPPRPSEPVDDDFGVAIRVLPIGNDYTADVRRTVTVRLVTPGIIVPPNSGPEPSFTYSPTAVLPLTSVVFDASGTKDEGAACGPTCTYQWDFGDGQTSTGIFATHQFRATGTYQVRLTVTDARGASATIAQAISVGAAAAPTAAFTFSPTAPAPGQTIFFTAEASRPATGRQIVAYDWNFGSGRTGTGVTISKGYESAGTYQVTLTVTDDAGTKGTVTQSVTVGTASGGGGLIAALTVTPPSGGTTSTPYFFDASGTRGPANVVEYRFRFGDGTPDVIGSLPFTSHVYTVPGSYVITVTARDVNGLTSLATVSINVAAAPPP